MFTHARRKDPISEANPRNKSKTAAKHCAIEMLLQAFTKVTSNKQYSNCEGNQSDNSHNSLNPLEQSSDYREEDLYLSVVLPNGDVCKHHRNRSPCMTGSCAQKRK